MGRIVLLETSDIGARYSAQAVKALGHEPFFLVHRLADYQADPRSQIESYAHAEYEGSDSHAIVRRIRELGISDLVAITSFSDSGLRLACEAAALLGVRGLNPAVIPLKNKSVVAKLTPEFSPATLTFSPEAVPEEEITSLLQISSKVILKPTAGAGALGVFAVHALDEIPAIANRIREKAIPSHLDSAGWIAQAFIEGQLASLEGYVVDGQVHFLGFTNRKKVGATESAASFPADSGIPERARTRARYAVQALMERSEYRNGYFHVEFIFTSTDCFLIDANVGRLGGGPIGELLALSFGVSPVSIYEHVLEVSLFRKESRNPYSTTDPLQESFAILYGLRDGGELLGVDFPLDSRHARDVKGAKDAKDARCYHTQLLGRGALVTPMGTDDWSWIGILSGLKADTLDVIGKLRIRTPHGVFPPCF